MALATSAMLALIAGGAMAAGQVQQGKAENKQADFQSHVAIQQAASERQLAAESESDYRKAQSARLAEIRAAMGASGTDTSTGTPLMALADYGAETERNALRIRSGGEVQSSRLEEQANFYRAAGRNAKEQGYYRAGASLLSGIGSTNFNGGKVKPK